MISSIFPFPLEKNTCFPSLINLKDTCGFASATLWTHSFIYLFSVASCFKNLYLTGVLKNNFSTIIVVPVCAPHSSISITFPAVVCIFYPVVSSRVLDIIVISDIAEILANASPLNPIVYDFSKSST